MIQWMLYALAAGALLAAAAAAADAAVRAAGRPARWVWCAALALSLAVPTAAFWAPRPDPAPIAAWTGAASPTSAGATAALAAGGTARWSAATLDRPLRLLWLASTLGALAVLGGMAGALVLRRRRWRAAVVDGVPVLVSARTGPAVVGLLRPAIVLPRWVADEMDPAARRLILVHEREHLRARDPLLLAMGVAVAVVLPWSPAGWWMLRRLRLAVEVDCDARVLARDGDVGRYGSLLLEVGRRGSAAALPAAALSEPAGFLERRIRMMTENQRGGARAIPRMLAVAAAAVCALAALPLPERPAALPEPTIAVSQDTTQPRIVNVQQLARALEAAYPQALRDAGVEGIAVLRVHVTAEGTPGRVDVVSSTRAEFGEATEAVMGLARFRPAMVRERPVPYVVEMPIQFTLARGSERPLGPVPPRSGAAISRNTPGEVQPRVLNIQQVARAIEANYPPDLRAAGITGWAEVRVEVDATGAVTDVEAAGSSHDAFGAAAARALRDLRFRPAVRGGEPVAASLTIPVQFTIDPAEAP